MPSCIVKGCSYSWKKKDPNIILHSFPNDVAIIKAWLLQTRQDFSDIDDFSRKVLQGKKTNLFRICSQHFSLDCYYQRGMITSLKKDALPTIFPENAFGINPSKKRVQITAPVVQPWVDTNGSDVPTSIVMGFPLKIVKVDPDFLEPSTSSSIFPGQNHGLSMPMKKKNESEQDISPKRASINIIEAGLTSPEPKETQTVGTNTEYFPGQRHKSTSTDPRFGMKHKEVQTKKTKCLKCHCNVQPDFGSPRQETSLSSAILGLGAEPSVLSPQRRLPADFPDGQNLSQGSYCIKEPSETRSSVPSSHFSKLIDDQDARKTKNGLSGIPTVKGEDCTETEIPEAFGPQDPISENKYIVFDSCLDKLIKSCRCLAEEDCDGRITNFQKFFVGSSVSVKAECSRGHAFHMWDSQP